MVKLIRLTTENNNQFEADMDSEIKLGSNASVALQNITFQTEFVALGVSGVDATIKYNFDETAYGSAAFNSNDLKFNEYTSANYQTFFEDLEGTLNNTCSIGSAASLGYPGNTAQMNNYMQFNVTADEEKKAIQLRLTPMLHPLLKTRAFDFEFAAANPDSDYGISSLIFSSHPAAYTSEGATADTTAGVWLRTQNQGGPAFEAIDYGLLSRERGTASSTLNRYIYPNDGVEWSKGSSVWWCRINNLIDNGGGKETNGFAIGLSKTPILLGTVLNASHQDYEIRCYKPADNVEYITPDDGGAHQDGGVSPAQVTSADEPNHDIMMLRKDRDVIRGFLISRDGAGGANSNQLFEYTIPEADKNKPLYPYAYFCGAFEHASMSQPSMTLDPFAIDRIQPNAYQAFMTPLAGDTYGYEGADGDPVEADENGYERASAAMQTKLPELDEDYWGGLPASSPIQLVKLTIAKDILRFLGFDGPDYAGSGDFTFTPKYQGSGFEIIPENIFQVTNSDNYVVVLDSHPLQSYDASTSQGLLLNDTKASKIGRRLNILATLPENDNNGSVEHEVNQLVYIDLDNAEPQRISNLRLRVLDKTLSPILTTGISVMTLLFKDN